LLVFEAVSLRRWSDTSSRLLVRSGRLLLEVTVIECLVPVGVVCLCFLVSCDRRCFLAAFRSRLSSASLSSSDAALGGDLCPFFSPSRRGDFGWRVKREIE
jgi:hypothetical protein